MESPDIIFGSLFVEVQLSGIFEDSKTFSDCIPKKEPLSIIREFEAERNGPEFDLSTFVKKHFSIPKEATSGFIQNLDHSIEQHIVHLWDILTRKADQKVPGNSLIPLPNPYIVPGGRFREIYYWDSYFTMLGLAASDRIDLVVHMVNNFAYLIRILGYIPNGNRTYFLSRSQPPFFSLMVNLLAQFKSDSVLNTYLSEMEKEYQFWMDGSEQLSHPGQAHRRVVQVEDGYLNRFYDDYPKPRQESYREDVTLCETSGRNEKDLFLNLRAACESGWDFSSRWCSDPFELSTIHTIDLIPVDLNVLLWLLEETLVKAYTIYDRNTEAESMKKRASRRANMIRKICWDDNKGYFFDFDFRKWERTPSVHAAGLFPLFAGIASEYEASKSAKFVERHLLQPGGINTTDLKTGQQWDAPNGWAPLQWIAYKGFQNYGLTKLASELRKKWMTLNEKVYKESGKLVEKYNVLNQHLTAGGGEYPLQDGFGWTNGIYMSLKRGL